MSLLSAAYRACNDSVLGFWIEAAACILKAIRHNPALAAALETLVLVVIFEVHFIPFIWGDPLTSEEGEQIAPPCYAVTSSRIASTFTTSAISNTFFPAFFAPAETPLIVALRPIWSINLE
jgi:hypothetical protein